MDKEALRKAAAASIQQGWLTKDNTFYPKKEDAVEHDLKSEIDALEKRDFSDKKRKEMADKGHALPDGSFPIETTGDLKNAIRAIGRAKDPAAAKAHIIVRAKELKATNLLPADWEGSEKTAEAQKSEDMDEVKKGMDDVARTACIIEHLNWLCAAVSMEEKIERDEDSDSPAHLEEIIKELCEYLTNRVAEETKEIVDNQELEEMVMELAAGLPKDAADAIVKQISVGVDAAKFEKLISALRKAGARHSAADAAHGEKITKALGEAKDHMDGMGKCLGKMAKVHGDLEEHHEEMKECMGKADGNDMQEHMDGIGKCMGKLDKLHKEVMDHHEKASDMMGKAMEHSKAVGFSADEDEAEKAKAAAELNKRNITKLDDEALKKISDDFKTQLQKFKDEADASIALAKSEAKKALDEKAELEKKHATFAADIEKRLKIVEEQPMPSKGAVFDVTKGHGSRDPGSSVEAKPSVNVVNRSPEQMRALLQLE